MGGNNWSCYNLGFIYENKQNYTRAKEAFNKACKLELKPGCDKFKQLSLKK